MYLVCPSKKKKVIYYLALSLRSIKESKTQILVNGIIVCLRYHIFFDFLYHKLEMSQRMPQILMLLIKKGS